MAARNTTTTRTPADDAGPVPAWWLPELGDYRETLRCRRHGFPDHDHVADLERRCREQLHIYDSPAAVRLYLLRDALTGLRAGLAELAADPTLARFRESEELDSEIPMWVTSAFAVLDRLYLITWPGDVPAPRQEAIDRFHAENPDDDADTALVAGEAVQA